MQAKKNTMELLKEEHIKQFFTDDIDKKYNKIISKEMMDATAIVMDNYYHGKHLTQDVDGLKQLENFQESAPINNGGLGVALGSAGLQTDTIAGIDKRIPLMARREMPKNIAFDIFGVQAMSQNTQTIFAAKARKSTQDGVETLFDEVDTGFTGVGTHAGNNPVDGTYTTGTGMSFAQAERLGRGGSGDGAWSDMSMSIESTMVTAKLRGIRTGISNELLQELRAVHQLDGLNMLQDYMSKQLTADINREMVRTMYRCAKNGSQQTTTAGTFDLDLNADGRHNKEKFYGLMYQINRECNQIGYETRTGRGNFIVVSADVASGLEMAGYLDTRGVGGDEISTVDCFAGVLGGRIKVYVDTFTPISTNAQLLLVGRKGETPWDAGIFYCPYVPISVASVIGQTDFSPIIGMKTQYGIVANPYVELADGVSGSNNLTTNSNYYYRKTKVVNLL